jgi:Methyltransferase domain
MGFFDRYDRFYVTSQTGPSSRRLNARYDAIIGRNIDLLRYKRVLDVASHDGRWSFAAFAAGCAHVTGIEARDHLVASANATFQAYSVDQARYRFIRADAFDALQQETFRVDTVLLLGFFYHVDRHAQLASLLADTGAEHIILDTLIVPNSAADGAAIIELMIEPTDSEGNAFGSDPLAIVGRPSRAAIRLIFGHFGYGFREVDWSPFLYNDEALADYYRGERATFVLSRAQD